MFSVVCLGRHLGGIPSEWVRFGHEESGSLDSIHHHEVLSALWHGLVSLSSSLQEFVETLHLFVFLHHIVDVIDLKLGNLGNLLLVLLAQFLLFVLLVLRER